MGELQEIYLDHAATSFPKPPDVIRAIRSWSENLGASAGRGDYPRAVMTGDMVSACRHKIAAFFGAPDPSRVIFTFNCTDALNIAIRGIGLRQGDQVIVGPTEHNSVMRPLNALSSEIGIEVVRLPAHPTGVIEAEWIEPHFADPDHRVRLVCLQHASNVLGAIHPLKEIARRCRIAGVPLLVDAAQTAGSIPINFTDMGVDLLALPGHKALQGPLGTGALIIAKHVDITPWRMGGTGSRSEEEVQPAEYPDRLESGSHNAPGIAGLLAGIEWIEKRGGVLAVRDREHAVIQRFLSGLADLERVLPLRVIGPTAPAEKSPVVAISALHMNASEFASRLWNEHRIMVRPGLHCAPSAHSLAETYPDGAVRFSFGPLTEIHEVESALKAVELILTSARNPEFRGGSSRKSVALQR